MPESQACIQLRLEFVMAVGRFLTIPIKECGEPLVSLADLGIACEPVYFNQGLTKDPRVLVRSTVASKLIEVQRSLYGFKLLVWDGFRTRQVQNALYENFYEQERAANPGWTEDQLFAEVGKFVSSAKDPDKIPPHSTGGAVDLTLTDLNGSLLDMGTELDDFSERAATDSKLIHEAAQKNRSLLVNAMALQGFVNYPDEWWHFSYGDQLAAHIEGIGHAQYGEVNVEA